MKLLRETNNNYAMSICVNESVQGRCMRTGKGSIEASITGVNQIHKKKPKKTCDASSTAWWGLIYGANYIKL